MGNIMNEESRGKGPIEDFVAELINNQCFEVEKNEKGTEKKRLSVALLCDLADANAIETEKYRAQAESPNAPGRLRMTIGQMLRARAKRRHGLYDINGDAVSPNEEFELTEVATETLDGVKIAKAKPVKETAEAVEAA